LTNTVQQTSEAEEYLVLDPQGRVRLATVQEHDGAFLPNIDFFKRGASGTTVQNTYVSSPNSPPEPTSLPPADAGSAYGSPHRSTIDLSVLTAACQAPRDCRSCSPYGFPGQPSPLSTPVADANGTVSKPCRWPRAGSLPLPAQNERLDDSAVTPARDDEQERRS
jgi:hypothetical protein